MLFVKGTTDQSFLTKKK